MSGAKACRATEPGAPACPAVVTSRPPVRPAEGLDDRPSKSAPSPRAWGQDRAFPKARSAIRLALPRPDLAPKPGPPHRVRRPVNQVFPDSDRVFKCQAIPAPPPKTTGAVRGGSMRGIFLAKVRFLRRSFFVLLCGGEPRVNRAPGSDGPARGMTNGSQNDQIPGVLGCRPQRDFQHDPTALPAPVWGPKAAGARAPRNARRLSGHA